MRILRFLHIEEIYMAKRIVISKGECPWVSIGVYCNCAKLPCPVFSVLTKEELLCKKEVAYTRAVAYLKKYISSEELLELLI